MKKFIVQFLKFLLNLIIVIGIIVSLGNFVLQLLPSNISQPVLDWLNTNLETLLPYGISSAITTVVLAFAKYFNTLLQVMLKDSERKQELQRKQIEESYNERIAIAEERDFAIVKLINENTELLKQLAKQNGYIIDYNKIVASKNIASLIIPDRFKQMFKDWTSKDESNLGNVELASIDVVEQAEKIQVDTKEETMEERELI